MNAIDISQVYERLGLIWLVQGIAFAVIFMWLLSIHYRLREIDRKLEIRLRCEGSGQ